MLGCLSTLANECVHEPYWNVKRHIFSHFRFYFFLFISLSLPRCLSSLLFVSRSFFKYVILSNNFWPFHKQWHSMKCSYMCVFVFFLLVSSLSALYCSFFFWLFKVVLCMPFWELNIQNNTMNWSQCSFYASSSTTTTTKEQNLYLVTFFCL